LQLQEGSPGILRQVRDGTILPKKRELPQNSDFVGNVGRHDDAISAEEVRDRASRDNGYKYSIY
jgi:hypothetical protein